MVLPTLRGCYNTYMLDFVDSNTHHLRSDQTHPNRIQLNTTVGYSYTQCGLQDVDVRDVRDVPNRDVRDVRPRLRLNENKIFKFLYLKNSFGKDVLNIFTELRSTHAW